MASLAEAGHRPWAGLAATGLAADMAGATVINATVLNNTRYDAFWLTVLLFAVFVILAYGRWQQIKGLAAAIRRVKNAGPGREDPNANGVGDGSGPELCPGP